MRLTEMRVQVEKRGGGVAADGALLGLAGPEVDRVDVARQGTCGERQTSKYYGLRFAISSLLEQQVVRIYRGDHATSCQEMYEDTQQKAGMSITAAKVHCNHHRGR